MLLKVMFSTAQPVFCGQHERVLGLSVPQPWLTLGKCSSFTQLPARHKAVTKCQGKELWPGAAKSRNDLLTFVFVFSYVRLPLRRKPKKQPPLLPACSLALNGTGLTRFPPQLPPRWLQGAWGMHGMQGQAVGQALVQPQVQPMTWAAFFKEQLQAGARAGSWRQQHTVFQGLALLRCEQEVLQSFSPLTWW